ncbi:MAG TPA: hypothetical protein VJZ00_02690, partial [Thermoanaerobaculia bacterium]|nr:hypothetical protein [Thermoanaerobaculia bacterium]
MNAMRTTLALFLILSSLSAFAQENDLEFAITAGAMKRLRVPIEITVPADELRFVDDRGQWVAKVSVRAVSGGESRVIAAEHRVFVPRGRTPEGASRMRFDVDVSRDAQSIDVIVTDLGSGRAGKRTIVIDGGTARVAEIASDNVAWSE